MAPVQASTCAKPTCRRLPCKRLRPAPLSRKRRRQGLSPGVRTGGHLLPCAAPQGNFPTTLGRLRSRTREPLRHITRLRKCPTGMPCQACAACRTAQAQVFPQERPRLRAPACGWEPQPKSFRAARSGVLVAPGPTFPQATQWAGPPETRRCFFLPIILLALNARNTLSLSNNPRASCESHPGVTPQKPFK